MLSDEKRRALDLADAWRHSHKELLNGRIGSIEAAYERRSIMREAEQDGLADLVRKIIHNKE